MSEKENAPGKAGKEAVLTLRRWYERWKTLPACPECRSHNTDPINIESAVHGGPVNYRCGLCGHHFAEVQK